MDTTNVSTAEDGKTTDPIASTTGAHGAVVVGRTDSEMDEGKTITKENSSQGKTITSVAPKTTMHVQTQSNAHNDLLESKQIGLQKGELILPSNVEELKDKLICTGNEPHSTKTEKVPSKLLESNPMALQQDESTEIRRMLQYIEEGQPRPTTLATFPQENNPEREDEFDVMSSLPAPLPLLARNHQGQNIVTQPGAYAGAPGSQPQRLTNAASTAVGNHPTDSSGGMQQPGPTAGEGLAEATPVTNNSVPDIEANPYDTDATERKRAEEKKQKRYFLFLYAVLLCGAIGTMLAVVLTNRNKDSEESYLLPTVAPSMSPSETPSSTPSGSLDLMLQNLPASTVESLKNISTPQWKAYDWLVNHPSIGTFEEWKKTQLFALVTFFYAFGGSEWFEPLQERWLQYEEDECYWYSSLFGVFFSDGNFFEMSHDAGPCLDDGGFTHMGLAFPYPFQLSGQTTFIPPEIALLTSLAHIELLTTIDSGSFNNLLPSQIFEMETLLTLTLVSNGLTGTIPTQLGLMTRLTAISLTNNMLTGPLPTELFLLTNLRILNIGGNMFSGSISTELAQLTKLEYLTLANSNLSGKIPSELALLPLKKMNFGGCGLSGTLPTELGVMGDENRETLDLSDNQITGSIPSELGLLTSIHPFVLRLHDNSLSGHIPSELGLLSTSSRYGLQIFLTNNALSGHIPSELGMASSITHLRFDDNRLSGSIPSELGLMTRLQHIMLNNNSFTGEIPEELNLLAVTPWYGPLQYLMLDENDLSGTVSEELCLMSEGNSSTGKQGILFDCGNKLCGCCWCPCPSSNADQNITDCPAERTYNPSKYDTEWPGIFPEPINSTIMVAVNIRFDIDPGRTSWKWSTEDEAGLWRTIDKGGPPPNVDDYINGLYSFTRHLESDTVYRLRFLDSWGIGTCCLRGLGWFTMTDATPSSDNANGTVVWEATGDELESSMDVYLEVGSSGNVQLVQSTQKD